MTIIKLWRETRVNKSKMKSNQQKTTRGKMHVNKLKYVKMIKQIVSSHDVVFDETFYSALPYTSRPYSVAIMTRTSVLYIPHALHDALPICWIDYLFVR